MRVLHVVKKFPDMLGGDGWAVDAIAHAMRARGDHAFVAAPNCLELRRDSWVRPFGRALPADSLDRLGLHRLALLRDLKRALPDLVRWAEPDLIHVHSADLGYQVSRSWSQLPVLLTCHSLTFPGRRWSLRGVLERWCLKRGRFAAVTTVHPTGVGALEQLGVGRVTWVPSGVDARMFAPREEPESGAFRLLYVGRLAPEKGLDVLLDAVALVQRPIRLALVGDGAHRAALEARTRSLRVGDRVVFEGPILARDAIAARYGDADAFVLPSLTEGLPLALLEAWASGLPVVATNVGGVADVAAGSALLVPPRDPRALANAIDALASDVELRRSLGSRGRSLVLERYSWEAATDRYMELYRSLLAGGGEDGPRAGTPAGR